MINGRILHHRRWVLLLLLAAGASSQSPTAPPAAAPQQQAAPQQDQPAPLEPPPAFTAEELGQADILRKLSSRSGMTRSSVVESLLGVRRLQQPIAPRASIIKLIFGFITLLVLAYVAGSEWSESLESRLRITHLVIAGLPFVFLGMAASHHAVGVFPPSLISELRPIIPIGLGWIGFTIGFRFDAPFIVSLARGAGSVAVLTAGLPFAAVLAVTFLVILALGGFVVDMTFLRDALLLATSCAMTGRSAPYLLEAMGAPKSSAENVARIAQLEQLAGIFGILMVSAYFRPQGAAVAWQLPGTGWLFIALGVAAATGGIIYALLQVTSPGPQFAVVTLGSVCLASGMASYLRLSSVAVCFIAGVILVNFPGDWKDPVHKALNRMERPIYLLFLTAAGTIWRWLEWQGWVVMLLFVAARHFGKWLAVRLVRSRMGFALTPAEETSLIFGPIGALSIAIVVSAADLYVGANLSLVLTTIIGGAVVTEIILQGVASRHQRRAQSLKGLQPETGTGAAS